MTNVGQLLAIKRDENVGVAGHKQIARILKNYLADKSFLLVFE